jgi:putative membrane protein
MKSLVSAVCCVGLCCALALAQDAHKKAASAGAADAMTDQQFVDFAAQTDMTEANLGQLAASQASAQGVKDYAQMLVTDHTNDYTQLGTVCAGRTVLESQPEPFLVFRQELENFPPK